jgi:YihY family inner membrane protein
VSTANRVPETFELTGDDAAETLRRTGTWQLVKDAFWRLRVADGFSHARSMAYCITLVLVQGIIALVGIASALGAGGVRNGLVHTMRAAIPGPAGAVVGDAVNQAHRAGASQQYLGLTFGLVGAVVAGSTLMGQLERGLNRLYGVEQDRPTLEKYTRAAGLAATAGLLAAASFGALALGRGIGDSISHDAAGTAWNVVRWPLAIGLSMASIALLFRLAPRRRQPAWSWLAFGATVAVGLWALATAGLGLFFSVSTSFGETYGPLAGIVALELWALLTSIAVLFGGAIAAQLEAVRAGTPAPQDTEKVAESEPRLEAEPLVGTASS